MVSSLWRTAEDILLTRWRGQSLRVEAIISDLTNGSDWTVRLLEDPEGRWGQLTGIGSCSKEKLVGEAAVRDLRGISLKDVQLSDVDGLSDTALDHATFAGCAFSRVSFIGASLEGAMVVNGALLTDCDFSFANLRNATCRDIALERCKFQNADIRGADFRSSAIDDCIFVDVEFQDESIIGIFSRQHATRFGGPGRAACIFSAESSEDIKQFIKVQLRISRFIRRQPGIAKVAYWLTNYGLLPGRLLVWIIGIWILFAGLYYPLGLPRFLEGSLVGDWLRGLHPVIVNSNSRVAIDSLADSLYFSLTTLTNLSFGDFVPAPNDLTAQLCVSVQSLLGCTFFAAFISLLLQVFVRRD